MPEGTLTCRLVYEAYDLVRPYIEETLKTRAKRQYLAIVVTETKAIMERDPDKPFKDNCCLVTSIGDTADGEHDYEAVALSKAEKSVRTGKAAAELEPHYLQEGDTVDWGLVVLNDIVVSCSGVEAYYSEMFSGWIAAAVKALIHEKYANLLKKGTEFIG